MEVEEAKVKEEGEVEVEEAKVKEEGEEKVEGRRMRRRRNISILLLNTFTNLLSSQTKTKQK